MYDEIVKNLNERMAGHVNSMCATDDEVRIAWLVGEVDRLRGLTKIPIDLKHIQIGENKWVRVDLIKEARYHDQYENTLVLNLDGMPVWASDEYADFIRKSLLIMK